jgi:hypothetical protein
VKERRLPQSAWAVVGVAAAACAAALAVWWATGPWGVGLSPDAIAYAAIAENLRDNGELGYWLEPHVSSWPPLFPAVLAGLSAVTGLEVVDAARAFNAVVHGATVIVAALLAWRMVRDNWLRAAAVAFAAIAQPLIFVSVRAWSEPLFNLLVLTTALVLSRVPGRSSTARVLLASGLTIATFTTRYAGLVLVGVGVLVLAIWPRSDAGRARVQRSLLFGVPAALGAIALVLWNRWRTGNAFGPRWRPDEPFWNHAGDGLAAIGRWALPGSGSDVVAGLVGALLFAVVAATLVRSWKEPDADTVVDADATTAREIGAAPVFAVFIVAYFVYMVWARTTSGFDPLNSRLMLPIFLPGVLLTLQVVDRVARRQSSNVARSLVLATPLLVLVPIATDGLDELRQVHDSGNEYGSAAVDEFLASRVWDELPSDCAVITNDPWLLWLRGVEAGLSPQRVRELAIPISMELDELPALVDSSDVCLVWMDTGSTVFYTPDQLRDLVHLDEVTTDGFTTIYRVTS